MLKLDLAKNKSMWFERIFVGIFSAILYFVTYTLIVQGPEYQTFGLVTGAIVGIVVFAVTAINLFIDSRSATHFTIKSSRVVAWVIAKVWIMATVVIVVSAIARIFVSYNEAAIIGLLATVALELFRYFNDNVLRKRSRRKLNSFLTLWHEGLTVSAGYKAEHRIVEPAVILFVLTILPVACLVSVLTGTFAPGDILKVEAALLFVSCAVIGAKENGSWPYAFTVPIGLLQHPITTEQKERGQQTIAATLVWNVALSLLSLVFLNFTLFASILALFGLVGSVLIWLYRDWKEYERFRD